MAEQATQFQPERPSLEEEAERMRLERSRVEQQEAQDFSAEMQRQAEARTARRESPAAETQPDIPGITREHKPVESSTEQTVNQAIDSLNGSLGRGVEQVLEEYMDNKRKFNPADATDMLADVMDK